VKCPSCGSTSFDLIETFEEIETRQVRNGAVLSESTHEAGSLLRSECHCSCGHHWFPRRITLNALERR
jgi:hypothetical protein